MKLLKLKRNQMMTLIDIFIIVVMMIFIKTYMSQTQGNYVAYSRDDTRYTFAVEKSEYSKGELITFEFEVENKSKKDLELYFERSVPFNLIIEKQDELVYKRDLIDSLTEKPKKIIIKRYGKRSFSYDWYGESNIEKEIGRGEYKATLYSLDLDVELTIRFNIY